MLDSPEQVYDFGKEIEEKISSTKEKLLKLSENKFFSDKQKLEILVSTVNEFLDKNINKINLFIKSIEKFPENQKLQELGKRFNNSIVKLKKELNDIKETRFLSFAVGKENVQKLRILISRIDKLSVNFG